MLTKFFQSSINKILGTTAKQPTILEPLKFISSPWNESSALHNWLPAVKTNQKLFKIIAKTKFWKSLNSEKKLFPGEPNQISNFSTHSQVE